MIDFPSDFMAMIDEQLGAEASSFYESLLRPQPPSVRYNPAKYLPQNLSDNVPWESLAEYKEADSIFATDPLWHGGAYYVQESSSMFLGYILRQLNMDSKACIAIDVCAAPGGKTTHLLQCLHQDSLVIANEIIPKRNAILRENLMRWGSPNIVVTQSEMYKWKKLPFKADLVLLDAPCSGEGLWRKQHAAIKEWSLPQVHVCATRQRELLEASLALVKDGGYLIYSTCTYNAYEDEQQLQYILQHGDFESVEIKHNFIEIASSSHPFAYKFYTHRVRSSGFFIAVFRKKIINKGNTFFFIPTSTNKFITIEDKILSDILIDGNRYNVLKFEDNLFLYPKKHIAELHAIAQTLYIKTMGVEIGKMIGEKKLQYGHAFAHCQYLDRSKFSVYNATYHEAISYLKKNDIPSDLKFIEGEYVLISYEGVAIGWTKYVQCRLKNLLPIPYRLRQN